MQLLLRRSQRQGVLGKVVFALDVRASLLETELDNIRRYKLGDTLLYSNREARENVGVGELAKRGGAVGFAVLGAFEAGQRLAHKMLTLQITVDDLSKGKRIECKDILEMLAAEQQVKEAAQNFQAILQSAAAFDGEEVLELA